MAQKELIKQIAEATLRKGERLSTVYQHMIEGVELLEEWGIQNPKDTDFLQLQEHYEALGEKRTAANRRRETKRYYDWLREQQQPSLFGLLEAAEKEDTDMSEIVDVEPVGTENEAPDMQGEVHEVLASENESAGQEQVEAVTTEKEDTDSPSPVVTDKPRIGRKPKLAADRRSEKMSIYLTPQLMADLKDLSNYSRQDISDVVFGLIENFTQRNSEILQEFREFLSRRKVLR